MSRCSKQNRKTALKFLPPGVHPQRWMSYHSHEQVTLYDRGKEISHM